MVMENNININEYNDLINESNIIRNEIEEIDKDIISSSEGIKAAGMNVKGALIAAGFGITAAVVTAILKAPTLVPLISAGTAAVSFNWALTAASYINIEKARILECDNKRMSLSDKQVELKRRILGIEKEVEKDFELTESNKNIVFNVKTKTGVKVKKRSITDNK